jgi:hypothetical protein
MKSAMGAVDPDDRVAVHFRLRDMRFVADIGAQLAAVDVF